MEEPERCHGVYRSQTLNLLRPGVHLGSPSQSLTTAMDVFNWNGTNTHLGSPSQSQATAMDVLREEEPRWLSWLAATETLGEGDCNGPENLTAVNRMLLLISINKVLHRYSSVTIRS
jgi:hypothetical protein